MGAEQELIALKELLKRTFSNIKTDMITQYRLPFNRKINKLV